MNKKWSDLAHILKTIQHNARLRSGWMLNPGPFKISEMLIDLHHLPLAGIEPMFNLKNNVGL